MIVRKNESFFKENKFSVCRAIKFTNYATDAVITQEKLCKPINGVYWFQEIICYVEGKLEQTFKCTYDGIEIATLVNITEAIVNEPSSGRKLKKSSTQTENNSEIVSSLVVRKHSTTFLKRPCPLSVDVFGPTLRIQIPGELGIIS